MALNIPGYSIRRTLGRGGMATVYLAIQEVFEREVALKVMSKVLAEDANFGQRFFREAKIVSKLVHPNIVTVHDVGMHDGYCYLSMEYIDGRDLKHKARGMSLQEKLTAVRDIAKALVYAGDKGYVHRDIKPENIMFHSSDGRAVLMDFGIAKAAESDTQVTQTGIAIGTPHYMSPEQAKGKTVDGRSDIYSLGVVFYYTLVGRVPYDAESAVAIGIKHITEAVPELPDAYASLQPLLDKMMAKDVGERYQNARELLADIDALDPALLGRAASASVEFANPFAFDATTTLHPDVDDYDEGFGDDELNISAVDLDTLQEYEVERDAGERAPMWPGLSAGLFVCAVIASFVYFKHPEWVRAQLERFQTNTVTAPAPTPLSTLEPPALSRATPRVSTPAPASLPSPSAEASPQVDRAAISALRNKIDALKTAFDSDAIHLSDLVAAYRALLTLAPNDPALQQEFKTFREQQSAEVLAYAGRTGSSPALEKRVSQHRVLFPEVSEASFKQIQTAAVRRKRILSHVIEGDAYLRQNNLTKPEGRNALDSYRAALALEPGNKDAKRGVSRIASKLADAAQRRYDDQKLGAALSAARASLELDPNNTKAQRLDKVISSTLDKEQRVENLLRDGKASLDRGNLFTPSGQSAFDHYRTVLLMHPDHQAAKSGLESVVDALSARVWALVGDQQFLQAKEMLRVPQREYSQHPRIQSLSAAVDEVIGDAVINSEPRIRSMVIRDAPFSDVGLPSEDSLQVDRSIFLGFQYENFQSSTTVLQAILMDGARRVQIAQVPVVVEGAKGQSTFRIDRPVEGFPAGSYTVEMRLGPETLNATLFKVE